MTADRLTQRRERRRQHTAAEVKRLKKVKHRRKPNLETTTDTADENPTKPVPGTAQDRTKSTVQPDATGKKDEDGTKTQGADPVEPDWDNQPRRGFFSGRPGPGRPKRTERSEDYQEGAEPEDISPDSLLAAFSEVLNKHGRKKFIRELLKRSPVSASALLTHLQKMQGSSNGSTGGHSVNILLPEGAPVPNLTDVPTPVPEQDKAPAATPIQSEPDEPDDWGDLEEFRDDVEDAPVHQRRRDRSTWTEHRSIKDALHPEDVEDSLW